jgi:hypothetical protein
MKLTASIAGAVTIVGWCALAAMAQDPAKTDPAHFAMELDNDHVRVLHVTVPAHTKVQVHELAGAVVVPLADYESTLKRANGETTTVERKTGKAAWLAAGAREFESGDHGVNALLIEIKPNAIK